MSNEIQQGKDQFLPVGNEVAGACECEIVERVQHESVDTTGRKDVDTAKTIKRQMT